MFEVPGLLPGDYVVNIKAAGFADTSQSLRLEVGQQLTINVDLSLKLCR